MRITIDPGHGPAGNPYPPKPGFYEGTQMWKLAGFLADELRQRGFEVTNTRPNLADDPPLDVRGNTAVKNGSAAFISLHSNAAADPNVRGTEVFYSVKGPQYRGLAESLAEGVADVMEHNSRGAKTRRSETNPENDYFGVIRAAANGGVTCALLIEHGFHTNPQDAAFLTDDENLKRIAAAEAEILAAYFGVSAAAQLYRVRKSWANSASQIGAFGILENAKDLADRNKSQGYKVFDALGIVVYDPNALSHTGFYRVRKSWANSASQIGAFSILENAKDLADRNKSQGYKVFDNSGIMVYDPQATGEETLESVALRILELVRENAVQNGIFPSVKAAQMLLESDYMRSELAVNANNYFGMKAMVSSNTWPGSTWDGVSLHVKETKEQDEEGNETVKTAEFRAYSCVTESIADHSAYLLGAKIGTGLRYYGLLNASDYLEQITIIRNQGYATDINYIDKLRAIIERYGLDRYDWEVCRRTPEEVSVDNALALGLITNREHWLGVLNGTITPVPQYIKILMDNAYTKLTESRERYE